MVSKEPRRSERRVRIPNQADEAEPRTTLGGEVKVPARILDEALLHGLWPHEGSIGHQLQSSLWTPVGTYIHLNLPLPMTPLKVVHGS